MVCDSLCNGSWSDDGRASDSRAGDSWCDGTWVVAVRWWHIGSDSEVVAHR